MVQIKTGLRLKSVTDTTEVIVVRACSDPVDLWCGGHPMVQSGEAGSASEVRAGFSGPTLVGKRYLDDDSSFELLCTKAGPGALSIGETMLTEAGAKALPSSD